MKQYSTTIACLALVLSLSTAQAVPSSSNYLVLNSSGGVYHGAMTPLRSGEVWKGGDAIQVPAGNSLTLLELGKGKRWSVSGPSTLKMDRRGLNSEGGSLVQTEIRHGSYGLSGENDRRIAGSVVRDPFPAPVVPSELALTATGTEQRPVLEFEYRGASIPPARVVVYGYPVFYPPSLPPSTDGGTARRLSHASYDNVPFAPLGEAVAEKAGGKTVYRFEPASVMVDGAPVQALCAIEERSVNGRETNQELLHANVQFPSNEQQLELQKARNDAAAWALEEPGSAEPWLVLGIKLRESGRLLEARDVLEKAAQLRPSDWGIRELRQQVMYELGDVAGAEAVPRPQ